MPGKEFNITKEDGFFIGDDVSIDIVLYDEDDNPLTVDPGWTFEWLLRRTRSADVAALTKTDAAITVIDTDNGTDTGVSVTIDAADTADFEAANYFHTLRRADDGSKTVLSYGAAVLQWSAAR